MAYTKLYVHIVWSTKYRIPNIMTENRQDLYVHMIETAREKGIEIDCINGWSDHVHLLIRLHPTQPLDQVIHAIKGESSYWFNRTYEKADYLIKWQRKYFATTVSFKDLEDIRTYIKKQEEHHSNSGFIEEFHLFAAEHGISKKSYTSKEFWE